MTDHFNDDDRQKAHQDKSFKEQILEEMRQASQQREARLAQEEKARQELALAERQAEEARLETERQARLAEEESRRQLALEAELADLVRREQGAQERERQEAAAEFDHEVAEPAVVDYFNQEPTADELEAERAVIGRELERDSHVAETAIPDVNEGGMIDFDSLGLDGYDGFGDTVIIERSTFYRSGFGSGRVDLYVRPSGI